eukprot:1793151-Alexandrium_andersonii.AAC.1
MRAGEVYDSVGAFVRRRGFLSTPTPGPLVGGWRRRKANVCGPGRRRNSGDRFPTATAACSPAGQAL